MSEALAPSVHREQLLRDKSATPDKFQETFVAINEGEPAYYMSHMAQEKFWRYVADDQIAEKRQLYLTADLLRKSLEHNPERVYYGDDSYAAKLIKESPQFKKLIDDLITKNGINKSEFDVIASEGFEKEGGDYKARDLFAAIHNFDVAVHGKKNPDGTWTFKCTLADVFNFDVFTTEPEKLKQLEWMGNNGAYISEKMGVIHQVPLAVDFTYNTGLAR